MALPMPAKPMLYRPRPLPATLALAAAVAIAACSTDNTPRPAAVDTGPMARQSSVAVPHQPGPLTAADVNGDGHLDVVVGGEAIHVLLGDGTGALRAAPGTPLAGPVSAEDFAFGDFDGDGLTDIVVAEHHKPRFFLFVGTDAGGFAAASGSPFTVDAEPHLHTIATADFNGDGHLDLVTDSWPESRLVVVEGRGGGTFATPGRQIAVPEAPIHNLRVADFNGDGHADIVTPAHDHRAVTVLLGDGRGSFAQVAGSPFASAGGFSLLTIADLDLDGDPDVAEVHRSDPTTVHKRDGLSILLNDGDAALSHAPGSPLRNLPQRPGRLAVGDVNGDGAPDIVALSEFARTVALFHGGESGFELAGMNAAGTEPRDVAVADLDGDGRAEILISDHAQRCIHVMVEQEPSDTADNAATTEDPNP